MVKSALSAYTRHRCQMSIYRNISNLNFSNDRVALRLESPGSPCEICFVDVLTHGI